MSCCILLLSQKRTISQTKTINRRPNSGKWRESSLRMSAKYGIAFSADMKSYPGKLWTVTAQNSNKLGLHTSNIAGAVDREDLHQIPILTVTFTSVSIGPTVRFDKERPNRLWHVTPGPLFDTSKTGGEVTVSCVNKSLIRFSHKSQRKENSIG